MFGNLFKILVLAVIGITSFAKGNVIDFDSMVSEYAKNKHNVELSSPMDVRIYIQELTSSEKEDILDYLDVSAEQSEEKDATNEWG